MGFVFNLVGWVSAAFMLGEFGPDPKEWPFRVSSGGPGFSEVLAGWSLVVSPHVYLAPWCSSVCAQVSVPRVQPSWTCGAPAVSYILLSRLPLFSSVWPLCPGCRSLHRGLKVFLLVPPWAQCVRLCLYRAGTPEMSWPLGFLSRFQWDHFSESELALQESHNSQHGVGMVR